MVEAVFSPLMAFGAVFVGSAMYFLYNWRKVSSDFVSVPSLVSVNHTIDDVKAKAEKYTRLHESGGGTKEERVANAQDMTNYYYDLVTDFYEFGWGQSFHFANRYKNESFMDSIVRHEYYLGGRLCVKPGERILDVGCGVGGPMRNIARFTHANVVGINNNAYQLKRLAAKVKSEGLEGQCEGVKGDFMNLPFARNSFDGVYAIEATCHAPDRTGCYRQIFNVLKPGKMFCGYEWVMTEKYNPDSQYHRQIKEGIEIGDSLPDIASPTDVRKCLIDAGFEILETKDLAEDSEVAWYEPFVPKFTIQGFKTTPIGIKLTNIAVRVMETLRLAPAGSSQMHQNLSVGAITLYRGGVEEIFTPMYFFAARKPLSAK